MAIQTFGSTLTDLQSGLNTAEGIDAQRYAAYLQARSEEQRTRAQREAALAKIIEDRNIRQQQGQQFDVNQRNLMDAARLKAATEENVARITAQNRAYDPRFADTIARIQADNNERENEVAYFKKLSDQRKALVAAKTKLKADKTQGFFDFGAKNDPVNDPQWKQLNDMIAKLDTQALTLGLAPAMDEGYVIPDFTPIPLPADPRVTSSVGGGLPASGGAFAPSLFSNGGFVLDPTSPASPARPAVAPSLPIVTTPVPPSAPAQTFTYEVDRNGNFHAVPVPRPSTPAPPWLRSAFEGNVFLGQ